MKEGPKAMFYGRELQAMKVDLALRVLKAKKALEERFEKYDCGAVGQEKLATAQAKRMRKAMKRLKEENGK